MNDKTISLRHWMWKALASTALIPLIAVELVLIGIYLFTNQSIRNTQIDYLHETAVSDLTESVGQNTHIINTELSQLGNDANLFARLTEHALQGEQHAPAILATSADGVRYDNGADDQVASFYSSHTPLASQDLGKVTRLATLDPLIKQLKDRNPLIASVYFNSWDSYNRIYPGFDILQQYPHNMNIPEYNFYYLADASNNPQRSSRWTEVYLDPAGNGWMMSAIAPVYSGDFLEGVVGLDITVSGILKQIGELKVPWDGYLMLVAPDLTIMVMPEAGEHDFKLIELTAHAYTQAVSNEMLKPQTFNLRYNDAHDALANAIESQPRGVLTTRFEGRAHLVAWDTVANTGWHLLAVVDEAAITATTDTLATHYRQVGYWLIGGLVIFYLGFFLFIWWRVKHLSQALVHPLAGVSQMMAQIGQGHWQPDRPQTDIDELASMARSASSMGEQLNEAQDSRHVAQQRLTVVMESSTEGLWEFDVAKRELNLRGSLCHRFNLPEKISDHRLLHDRLQPADSEALIRFIKDLEKGRYHNGCELRLVDHHGKTVWLQCRGRVLARDPDNGKPLLLAGTCMDINGLKNVETDLRLKTLEAETASLAKSRFISSMTHELKTPLNAIHGFAQLLSYNNPGSAGPVDEIIRASNHLCQLVNDLLSWSSVQAEQARLQLAPIDTTQLLRECVDMVSRDAQEAELTLSLGEIQVGPGIIADARRLRQVILNLLSNAIKYNRPGGAVTVSCRHEHGRARIYVEDSGLGIDSQARTRLFEPFQRLGQENTAIPGTGIGLALCKELAQRMNGEIGVTSTLGSGSLFWIELPCAQSEPTAAASNRQASVLCLQQDNAERALIRQAFKNIASVRIVDEDRLVLEQMSQAPVQLLLIDLDCIGSAIQPLLVSLQELYEARCPPVIVMSSQEIPRYLLNLNCQGLLSKPVDPDELRELAAVFLCEDIQRVP